MRFKKATTLLLLAVETLCPCYFGIKTIQKASKNATEQIATIPDFAQRAKLISRSTPSVFIAFHRYVLSLDYAKSLRFVGLTYGLGLLFWVTFMVFLQLNLS